jgi:List-Bact-rpt repeat protein
MRERRLRVLIGAICVLGALLGGSAQAQAGSEPLFVFTPKASSPLAPPIPPPFGYLEDPCGMGVAPNGNFYVSDYYHDAVDVYDQSADYTTPPPPALPPTGATGYLGQTAGIDPVDGPCGLAFDAAGDLYVNDYHRAVIRYGPAPGFGSPTTITGATAPDETHPTGVATDPATGRVYVDERTYVAVFEESGAPVEEGGQPLRIGEGTLQDGYGIAFSSYPGTEGRIYLPDAATATVKVYDTTALDKEHPVAVLDGSGTPEGKFVSLRDSAVAVDRVTGEVYVLDDLQPTYTERPQAVVYVFSSAGAYEGHLKYLVTDGWPSGLAVDDSATATQGRVYLTSGNTAFGSIYAYGPGAATTAAFKLSTASVSLAATGTGAGTVRSAQVQCASSCEEVVPAGSSVTVSAQPAQGSAFAGWSGACSGSSATCELTAEESAAVAARFTATGEGSAEGSGGSPAPSGNVTSSSAAVQPQAAGVIKRSHHHRKHHHRHRKGRRR